MGRKIFSYLALIAGEAIIIAAFLLFGKELGQNVMILDIVVSSIIFILFFIDILVPAIRVKVKNDGRIGGLGVRWFATWTYTALSIAVMIVMGSQDIWQQPFNTQLLTQCILLFLLILSLAAAFATIDKVEAVAAENEELLSRKEEVKQTASVLLDTALNRNAPAYLTERIQQIADSIRYLSPVNTAEASHLESQIIHELEATARMISTQIADDEQIVQHLSHAERLVAKRKACFSN